MKNQNKLYALILMLLLAGCKNKHGTQADYELSYPRGVDTVYVIRTLDQSAGAYNRPRKYVAATNAYGNDYYMMFTLNKRNNKNTKRDNMLSFISPWDTLIMVDDQVVKNLTFEHEKAKYSRNSNQKQK